MIPQVASPAFGAAPVFSLKVHRIGTGLTEEDLFVGYTPYPHG
jgi:hypothetical protein